LRKEKLKQEVDKICAEMIAKLDKYQRECYENIASLKIEKNNSGALLEVQKYLDKWTRDNNQLLIVSNDSKRQEIQTRAKELNINLFARYETLKEELMMNRVWFYIESETVVDDLQKELIQFDR